jgi:hypothetical protein
MAAYLGLGGLCLVSLPGVFLLGPLLVADLVRVVRGRPGPREVARQLTAPVIGGLLPLAHLATAVRRQSYLVHDMFWQGQWIHAPVQALAQFGSYAANFGLLGLTEPDNNPTTPFKGSALLSEPAEGVRIAVGLLVGGLLVIGLARALRRRDPGQATDPSGHRDLAVWAVAVATLGAIALITIGALADIWPAGAVRVNLFLVPLLSLLAVTGAVTLVERAPGSWSYRTGVAVASLLGLALFGVGVHWVFVARQTSSQPILLGEVRHQLGLQRAAARPGDVVIVLTGRMQVDQWTKGARFYTSMYPWSTPGVAIPTSATLTGDGWTPGAATRWLASRDPHAVFVSTYNRVTASDAAGLAAELHRDGWCPVASTSQALTGAWTELTRCR